jgi:glycosyltransferase involved in cell wall biosynthesis
MSRVESVLITSSLYRPNIGGVETTVDRLSHYYKEEGKRVSILTKRFPRNLSEHEVINGISVYRLTHPTTKREHLMVADWIKSREVGLRSDIVHIMGVRRPLPIYGLMLARKWDVPCVVTYTGGDLPDQNDPAFTLIWEEGKETVPKAVIQADVSTAFSQYIKKQAIQTIGEHQNIEVIHAGIDLDEIRKSNPMKLGYDYFFTARRLSQVKGIDLLLTAFANVSDQLNINLVIAGDGEERANLKQQAYDLGIINRVVFTGNLTLPEVYRYMKGSLAHICPSRAEGGGCVNYEAQAASTIAVGSDAGGIPEYIKDGETGYIFPTENVEALSQLLLRIASDRQEQKLIIESAGHVVEQFSWQTVAQTFLNRYDSAKNTHTAQPINIWSLFSRAVWNKLNQ